MCVGCCYRGDCMPGTDADMQSDCGEQCKGKGIL